MKQCTEKPGKRRQTFWSLLTFFERLHLVAPDANHSLSLSCQEHNTSSFSGPLAPCLHLQPHSPSLKLTEHCHAGRTTPAPTASCPEQAGSQPRVLHRTLPLPAGSVCRSSHVWLPPLLSGLSSEATSSERPSLTYWPKPSNFLCAHPLHSHSNSCHPNTRFCLHHWAHH